MSRLELTTTKSFELLFKEHYSYLCAVSYYMLLDEEAAKDIVQDFFLTCWDKGEELQIRNSFKSYAVKAIRNATLNYIKRSSRMKSEDMQDIERRAAFLFSEDYVEDDSKNKALWSAIAQLPEQRKKIFLLSNIDGLKYQEIANKLDISINTVKTQIRLAFQFLRTQCKEAINLILLFGSIIYSIFFTHF